MLVKSFIHDHLATMDFCEYPELKRLHGAMSTDYANRSPSVLKPILVLSKFPFDSSFQITPMEGYRNITEEDVRFLNRWEDKTDNRLFWRGSTTGGYGAQRDWRDSHRMRLHLMINGPKGGNAWWDQQMRDVMVPDGEGGFKTVRRWERVLSKAYVDVKLSGHPIQVSRLLANAPADWVNSVLQKKSVGKSQIPLSSERKYGLMRPQSTSIILMSMEMAGRRGFTGFSVQGALSSSLQCFRNGIRFVTYL